MQFDVAQKSYSILKQMSKKFVQKFIIQHKKGRKLNMKCVFFFLFEYENCSQKDVFRFLWVSHKTPQLYLGGAFFIGSTLFVAGGIDSFSLKSLLIKIL